MPSIYALKPKFQVLLRPVCQSLATAGVSANQVSLAVMLLSVAAGICIALQPQDALPVICIGWVVFYSRHFSVVL